MKTYKIPVVYQMYGYVYVQAESMSEAVDEVQNGDGALPDNGEYIDGSFEVDHDGIVEEIE
jgi:hypothetical protein